ncbi:TIGR02302 family protein [Xanthobacter sp. YC-JY1]|uniref:TIGR02302 family protein n=1 Tax=Xanthobacter sp. YC-JY1 TaxID=2419844 RepID=UPI001F48B856|nr:TIGR02302 family protein [Xanthobacter sp. YC-JY1]UJX47538.1 TIGR02302 family protein [Xanthobacter sp. YC-JY1]
MSASRDGKLPRRPQDRTPEETARDLLERAIGRARYAVFWERAWPAFARVGVAVALFLAVSFAGVWVSAPVWARIVGVVLFALAILFAARPLLALRWPSREEAVARLDARSALAHRPATAISDSLATRPDDPVGAALWRAHLARALAAARSLKAGTPSPGLARLDPRAVRALAVLALAATIFMAPGQHLSRIGAAFDWKTIVPPPPYRLDAWIDPPAYTGRPPVVLPGLRSDDPTSLNAAALQVPVGSTLVVRGSGIDTAAIKLDGGIAEAKPEADAPTTAGEKRYVIREDSDVTFLGPDQRRLAWHFKVLADQKPTISFAKDPQTGQRNALVLSYRMEDDYGVKEADALFTPLPPEQPLFPRPGASPRKMAQPLIPPPDFKLTLPAGGRTGAAQTTKDLVAHPWAGARVEVQLKARDEAGNEGVSDTKVVRLPARAFSKPLAKALIDERRRLTFDASNRRRLVTVLEGLTIAPAQFAPSASEYLGLRTALARAKNARNDDDLRALVDYLWEVAVLIEDGTLSDAERELRAAQEALREALERGASDEEIKRLTQDLRAAMEKMMRQLAEQARRDGGTDARPLDPNTRIVRPQDLQKMLDRIENLARSGNKDAARELLDQLQAMMENMRPGSRQAGRQQQGQQQQSEIGKMIQEQQRLRDRTWRQNREGQQGQQGQQGQRGQQGQQGQGQQGQQGQGQQPGENGFSDLQQGQQELRKRLGRMLDQMRRMQEGQQGQGQGQQGQNGEGGEGDAMGRAGEAMGRAEQAMREAEEALGRGEGQGALDAEGRALQSLRQGAQAMAEAQRGQQEGQGPGGPGEESAQRTDPLGRPLRSQDYGDDFTVKVPDEVDAQRARRVLEELRRRLEQPERPQIELDYLERLLRGLN